MIHTTSNTGLRKKSRSIGSWLYALPSMKDGFIFLEILIAITLVGVVFITLLGMGFSTVTLSASLQKTTRADALSREEFEAIRTFRNATTWGTNGLGSVAVGSSNPYYALLDTSTSPAQWTLHMGSETVDIFTRSVVFDKVSRDPTTQAIEATYTVAHNDADTIKATVTISWPSKSVSVVEYFTNWQK